MGRHGKDWEQYVGKEFGMLKVLEILPREYRPGGKAKPIMALCRCECGTEKAISISQVVRARVASCGCMQGKCSRALPAWRLGGRDAAVVARLKPKYKCKATLPECLWSSQEHLCCHECDKYSHCPYTPCRNSPEKCGAKLREKH